MASKKSNFRLALAQVLVRLMALGTWRPLTHWMEIDRDLSRDDWIKVFINGNEVLGCFGQSGLQRKKNLPTAISMQLFGVFFLMFSRSKNDFKNFFCPQKIKKTTWKSCLLMAVGSVSFLCSPDCPKQPRTSFPFYKFFYPTILCRISESTIAAFFTVTFGEKNYWL